MCAYMKLCFNRKYPGLFRIQSHTFFGNMTWKVKPLTTEPNSHWGICQKVISYKKIDVHPPIKKCILGFFITRKLCNFKIHAKLLLVFLLTCLITFFPCNVRNSIRRWTSCLFYWGSQEDILSHLQKTPTHFLCLVLFQKPDSLAKKTSSVTLKCLADVQLDYISKTLLPLQAFSRLWKIWIRLI